MSNKISFKGDTLDFGPLSLFHYWDYNQKL